MSEAPDPENPTETTPFIGSRFEKIFCGLSSDHIARFLPDVDFAFDTFDWVDPVWGKTTLDQTWGGIDQVNPNLDYTKMFQELFLHPAIKRLIGIEQLTLPPQYETIPNAARFSRWEHITGSALLVKNLIEKWNTKNPEDEIGSRQKVIYMLRTMLSDVGHTVGSHLGDWAMNDYLEIEHDIQLKSYLIQTGVADILQRFSISLDEVVLTEVTEKDFVECPSPNLCIDRIDYAIREIHRTNRYFDDPAKRFTINDFELVRVDGSLQVVMKSQERALEFAKAYELLAKEDWSEPLQRLQTTVYTDLIKLVLVSIGKSYLRTPIAATELPPFVSEYHTERWIPEYERHPRDIMMYTETVISATIASAYDLIHDENMDDKDKALRTICHLDYIMRTISKIAKDYYLKTRSDEVVEFMRSATSEGADPNKVINSRQYIDHEIQGSLVNKGRITIGFNDVTGGDRPTKNNTATVRLKKHKKRSIDPLVLVNGGTLPLSNISGYSIDTDNFEGMLASLTFEDNDLSEAFEAAKRIVDSDWDKILQRKRLSTEQLQDLQRKALESFVAATDYWKFTRFGALLEEEESVFLRNIKSKITEK